MAEKKPRDYWRIGISNFGIVGLILIIIALDNIGNSQIPVIAIVMVAVFELIIAFLMSRKNIFGVYLGYILVTLGLGFIALTFLTNFDQIHYVEFSASRLPVYVLVCIVSFELYWNLYKIQQQATKSGLVAAQPPAGV